MIASLLMLGLGLVESAQNFPQRIPEPQLYMTYQLKDRCFTHPRENFAYLVGKAFVAGKAYEEGLAILRRVPESKLADPAGYWFYTAVAQYGLLQKSAATRSLELLNDVSGAPDRYVYLGLMMREEMKQWKDDDLGAVGRKMDNVSRRLALAKGGKQTQKLQKEILNDLDRMIAQAEQQQKQQQQQQEQQQQAQGKNLPNKPMDDSKIAKNSGPGNVDQKRLTGMAQNWGRLPEKERAKAMQDLIREMPPRHREVIEAYFKKLAQTQQDR